MVFNNRELIDDQPVIIVRVGKVHQPNLVGNNLPLGVAILDIHAIGQHPVERPVVNNEGWRVGAGDPMIAKLTNGVDSVNGTALVIDDRLPVPAGEFIAAPRMIAFLGSGDYFAGDDPRSAWQWVIRLDDGTHTTLTFLVNHNRQPIRMFSAALLGDPSLLGKQSHCDAHQVIGKSAMVRVVHKPTSKGGHLPTISEARALPEGVEPIVLADACVWQPSSKIDLPAYAPQWVRNYANLAVRKNWEMRNQRKGANQ